MRDSRSSKISVCLALLVFLWASLPAQQPTDEERVDQFSKWLQQDVLYVISSEEKEVFLKLTTDEERLRFIEEFWRSRDPNPSTAENEFRDEHYRRIAYANEHFDAGKPGWKTDRGMIYIKFGPPDRRQTNPTGGRVYRTKQELIASERENAQQHMTALPFEIWEYRYIEGFGQEIAFEFVAKDGTLDYTLALSPDDKDALFFNTGSHIVKGRGRHFGLRMYEGNPLDRLEKVAAATRPLPIGPPETFVSTRVQFSEFPFSMETSFESLGKEQAVFDLQVEVPHRSLSFNAAGENLLARVDVEIFIRDIRKIVVGHRSEQLETRLLKSELRTAMSEASQYETRFFLPPGRYLVEVWLKDLFGDVSSYDQKLVVISDQESEEGL